MGARGLARSGLVAATLLSSTAGAGGDPERVGEFRDWSVYRYEESGRRVCYAASAPVSRRGETEGWEPSWILLTYDPVEGIRNSVSFALDRPLAPDAAVRANVGEQQFELAADGDTAWTVGARVDLRLVAAMKRGRRMTIGATSASGERVIDSFSLMGFTRALEETNAACPR